MVPHCINDSDVTEATCGPISNHLAYMQSPTCGVHAPLSYNHYGYDISRHHSTNNQEHLRRTKPINIAAHAYADCSSHIHIQTQTTGAATPSLFGNQLHQRVDRAQIDGHSFAAKPYAVFASGCDRPQLAHIIFARLLSIAGVAAPPQQLNQYCEAMATSPSSRIPMDIQMAAYTGCAMFNRSTAVASRLADDNDDDDVLKELVEFAA